MGQTGASSCAEGLPFYNGDMKYVVIAADGKSLGKFSTKPAAEKCCADYFSVGAKLAHFPESREELQEMLDKVRREAKALRLIK